MKDQDQFFRSRPIPIEYEMKDTGEVISFVVFMRPVKVKDIETLNRIVTLQEEDPDDQQAAMMLVDVMTSTLSMPSEQIPIQATNGLITAFIKYNFPKKAEPKKSTRKRKKDAPPKKDNTNGLSDCFDFLISCGHNYFDILDYPVPLFDEFVDKAAERLGIKKKVTDPAAAFRKLGLPIKPKSEMKT